MRPWTRRLLLASGGGFALFAPLLGEPVVDSPGYVQSVTASTARVRRATAAPTQLVLRVHEATSGALVVEHKGALQTAHDFPIEGLQAGGRYRWTLAESGADSVVESGAFVTPPADDRARVRWVALGDSGGQPWWCNLRHAPVVHGLARLDVLPGNALAASIATAAAAAQPDFWLHLGDVIYPNSVRGSWHAGFFAPFAPLLRTSPCYVTFGNHDVEADGGRTVRGVFSLPTAEAESGAGTPLRMYTFGWGPVRTIVLDTNAPIEDVMEFVRPALAAATEPWIVVTGHHPARSVSRNGDHHALQKHLVPELLRAGICLYVSGHDHNYQRCELGPGLWQIVSGGGGKNLYELHPEADTVASAREFHWLQADVEGPVLRLVAHAVDGRQLDTLQIDVAEPERLARIRACNPHRAARIDALRR